MTRGAFRFLSGARLFVTLKKRQLIADQFSIIIVWPICNELQQPNGHALAGFYKTLDSKEKIWIGAISRLKVAGGRAMRVSPFRGDNRLLIPYRVLPSVGKLATCWCDCGGHLYWLNCLNFKSAEYLWPNCLDAEYGMFRESTKQIILIKFTCNQFSLFIMEELLFFFCQTFNKVLSNLLTQFIKICRRRKIFFPFLFFY